ncbi:hypothetical protein SLEP1_g43936 [Rubroshorea leprosula]|nr:hypothetical protein SLEP1_g43936 [Rubroshorea leprosula]
MIMMFACAFPLAFVFAAINNLTEIRTDALKLLVVFKRPVPRAAATMGAWLNIFQVLWSSNFPVYPSIMHFTDNWQIQSVITNVLSKTLFYIYFISLSQ